MKTFAIAALLSAATGAVAQDAAKQSAPFNLIVNGGKYKNEKLTACHEGAAIEGLCVGYGGSEFRLNTTSGYTPAPGNSEPGRLVYSLPVNGPNGGSESEAMTFYYQPSTDVALPLFEPTYPNVVVEFDQNKRMNVPAYIDDTVAPPKAGNYYPIYRWYVCETYYTGYTYTTLAWKLGSGRPQNPSCVKVDVTQKFI